MSGSSTLCPFSGIVQSMDGISHKQDPYAYKQRRLWVHCARHVNRWGFLFNKYNPDSKNACRIHIFLWCKHIGAILTPSYDSGPLELTGVSFSNLGPWQPHIASGLCSNCRTNKPLQSCPGLFHSERSQPPSWTSFTGSLGSLYQNFDLSILMSSKQ